MQHEYCIAYRNCTPEQNRWQQASDFGSISILDIEEKYDYDCYRRTITAFDPDSGFEITWAGEGYKWKERWSYGRVYLITQFRPIMNRLYLQRAMDKSLDALEHKRLGQSMLSAAHITNSALFVLYQFLLLIFNYDIQEVFYDNSANSKQGFRRLLVLYS